MVDAVDDVGSHAPVVDPAVAVSTRPTNVPFTYLPSEFLQLPWMDGLPHPVITKYANPTTRTWLEPFGHVVPPARLVTIGTTTSCGESASSTVYWPLAPSCTIWLKGFQSEDMREFRPWATGPVLLPGLVSTAWPTEIGQAIELPLMVLRRSLAPLASVQLPPELRSSDSAPLLDELPSP